MTAGLKTTSAISVFLLSTIGFYLFAPHAIAGDLEFSAGIDAEIVEQQINVDGDDGSIGSSNQILRPYLQAAYVGRDVRGIFASTHNHVRRQLQGTDAVQNYLELNYSGSLDVVKGLISADIVGSQSYRSEGLNAFLVDDFLLNSENLSKINSNRASLSLTLPRGKYFGVNGSIFYSQNESQRNQNNTSSIASIFNSKSSGASFSAISGKRIKGIRSTLTGSTNLVERNESQNFESQTVNFNNDIKVFKQLGFALNASYENNEVSNDQDNSNGRLQEFYSLGAGLLWQSGADRFFEAAINRSYSDSLFGGEEEQDTFISYDFNWAFSERTSVAGTFTRRFYGDAGSFSFTHNLRNWRSSVSYNETVNTTSQLASQNNVGLFICNGGSTNLADCSLSDSITPDLQTGQTLQPLAFQSFELNDNIILNKNLTAQTALTRRRTTVSLTAIKSEIDELLTERIFDTTSVNLGIAFKLSTKSTLNLSSRFNAIDSELGPIVEKQTSTEQSVDLTRRFSRQLSGTVELRHLNRNGELLLGGGGEFRGLNGPLTDTRLTVTVSYKFGS